MANTANPNFVFKFSVLGEKEIFDTPVKFKPDNPLPFELMNQYTMLYQFKVSGVYIIQNQELGDFLKKEPITRYIPLFFEEASTMVFITRSLASAQQLLKEQNRPELFKYVNKYLQIYVITEESHDDTLAKKYQELFKQYFVNMGDITPVIFSKGTEKKTFDVVEKILRHYFLQFAIQQSKNDPRLTLFGMCAICREEKTELQVHDEFVICNSCDPADFNEDKMRAWMKLDR